MTRTPVGRYNPFSDTPPPTAPVGGETEPAPAPAPTGRVVPADELDSFTQSLVSALPVVPVVQQAPTPVGETEPAPAPTPTEKQPAHQPRRLLAAGVSIVAGLLLAIAGWQLRGGVAAIGQRPNVTRMPPPATAPTPLRKVLP